MKLKVCGMKVKGNMNEVATLQPDFMGFIFYPKSPRYVEAGDAGQDLPQSVKRVGVFVNASKETIEEKVKKYQLDFVQLHGDESVELAWELKSTGVGVIKVLSVMNQMPVALISAFEGAVDYFLFDTKTPKYGGSGKKFDWNILKNYASTKPFFLSGGIDLEDLEVIKNLNILQLYAIDVNSKFELEPGLKDIEKLKELKSKI